MIEFDDVSFAYRAPAEGAGAPEGCAASTCAWRQAGACSCAARPAAARPR
ncbi:MAG: hypothetical protein ACLR3C_06215 [Eggerthella lenta]